MHVVIENPIALQLFVFSVVVASLIAIGSLKASHDLVIESRVRRLKSGDDTSPPGQRALLKLRSKIPQLTEYIPGFGRQRLRLQKRFFEAGIYQPWALPLYVASRFALMTALPVVCFTSMQLLGRPLSLAILAGGMAALLGVCLPHAWLERHRTLRQITLRRSIPDFLDLIVACLAGGLSVQAALRQVADELELAHPDLSAELHLVLREIELGGTLDHALQQLATRTGMDELRTLRTFVHQTTKFGTTITEALAQLAEMLRMQREQRAEELAQKAAVKILFPTFLFIFPTIFVVIAGPAAIQIKEKFASTSNRGASAYQQK
jgi:tight adherence protein C